MGHPFSLSLIGCASQRFADDVPPSAWAPAVDELLHGGIGDAKATADGTLIMRLRDGTELQVLPIPQYEAWQIDGPEGIFAVCGPGGRLSRGAPRQTRTADQRLLLISDSC